MARQQARRQHRERLVGITLAVLGVVVLVVAAIAISEPKSHTSAAAGGASTSAPASTSVPAPSTTPRPTRSASSSKSEPGPSLSLGGSTPTRSPSPGSAGKLPLVVLNNTSTNGLATDAAQAFRNGGWTVSDVGNLQNEIISSAAYYDPSVDGAEAAAKSLRSQFPGIQRVVEKFSELPSGPIVVVLTGDYTNG